MVNLVFLAIYWVLSFLRALGKWALEFAHHQNDKLSLDFGPSCENDRRKRVVAECLMIAGIPMGAAYQVALGNMDKSQIADGTPRGRRDFLRIRR